MLVESQRRWLTQEIQDELERRKPAVEVDTLARLLRKPAVISALGDTLQTIEATLMLWQMDHRAAWRQRNARHTARELIANKSLFDTVERQPLTPEQAKAVVCFDNKVRLLPLPVPVKPQPWSPGQPMPLAGILCVRNELSCWRLTSKQRKS